MVEIINRYQEVLRNRGCEIIIRKVPAHELSDTIEARGNHMADLLAGIGCTGLALAPTFSKTLPKIENDTPLGMCSLCTMEWKEMLHSERETARRMFHTHLQTNTT